ncbi:MAG: membrane protein insertase YidC, partial [Pseudomonadota bacterium]
MDRNFILALVLTALIFVGYDTLIVAPKREAIEAQRQAAAEQAAAEAEAGGVELSSVDDLVQPMVTNAPISREDALAKSPGRLSIETPQLKGSINLRGLTFDDVTLTQFRETVEPDSQQVTILTPQATGSARYLRAGVFINNKPDDGVVWQAPEGAVLTPETPVTLTRNADGIEHKAEIAVDDKFMFTVTHTVVNRTSEDITVMPYGASSQRGIPADLENFMILFEGPLSVVDGHLTERKYKKLLKNNSSVEENGTHGWVGITDKFWLGAVIPPQGQPFKTKLDARNGATPTFRALYQQDVITVPSGQGTTVSSHIFAGAKQVEVLKGYQKPVAEGGLNIDGFDRAVDWGNFFF